MKTTIAKLKVTYTNLEKSLALMDRLTGGLGSPADALTELISNLRHLSTKLVKAKIAGEDTKVNVQVMKSRAGTVLTLEVPTALTEDDADTVSEKLDWERDGVEIVGSGRKNTLVLSIQFE